MVLEKASDRGKAIEPKTNEKEKKDYHRQLCERLHLDSPRDDLSHISSHNSGAEKIEHTIDISTDKKEKKDFLRQLCERLHLDLPRDDLLCISSQKLVTENTDHPIEARKEAPFLPNDQRHQAMLSRKKEMIPARVIKPGKQGETYGWKPLPMEEMRKSDAVFLPNYLARYDSPTYCEQLKETENLDAKSTMGSIRLMETKASEQYVVKRVAGREKCDRLLRQVRRMQEMRAAGIDSIVNIVDMNIKDGELYYVMPYLKGKAVEETIFEHMTDKEFLGKLDTMLSQVDQELWSKGASSYEQHHFSQRLLPIIERRLEGLRNIFSKEMPTSPEKETFTVNGEQVMNLPVLLSWLKQSSSSLDGVFATAKIPAFTHGDLHFGNIIFDEAGKLHLIDPSPRREKSVAEFEASLILGSVYREIIISKECSITQVESGELRLQHTERGLKILQRRQQVLDAIMKHPNMQKWFTNKKQSRHMIELLEAIFLAVITRRHPQLVSYVLGTQLLEQALRKSGFCDAAILEHEKQHRLRTLFKRDSGTEVFFNSTSKFPEISSR